MFRNFKNQSQRFMATFRNFKNQSHHFMTIFSNLSNQGVTSHSKIKILKSLNLVRTSKKHNTRQEKAK